MYSVGRTSLMGVTVLCVLPVLNAGGEERKENPLTIAFCRESIDTIEGMNPLVGICIRSSGPDGAEVGEDDSASLVFTIETGTASRRLDRRSDFGSLAPQRWRAIKPGDQHAVLTLLDPSAPLWVGTVASGTYRLGATVGVWIRVGEGTRYWEQRIESINWNVAEASQEDAPLRDEIATLQASGEYGSERYLNDLQEIIQHNSKNVIARQLQLHYVIAAQRLVSSNAEMRPETVEFLCETLERLIVLDYPYSRAVVTRSYLEFLAKRGRWDVVRVIAKNLRDLQRVHGRLAAVGAYIGAWGAMIDSPELSIPQEWREELRAPLLRCLGASLESDDAAVYRTAVSVLQMLEDSQQWELVVKAAECILRQEPDNTSVREALDRARDTMR